MRWASTQPPIRWIPGVYRGYSSQSVTLTTNPNVKERVGLYFYSPSGPSWPVLGWILPLPLPLPLPSPLWTMLHCLHVGCSCNHFLKFWGLCFCGVCSFWSEKFVTLVTVKFGNWLNNGLDGPGFEPRQEQWSFTKTRRPFLEPIQTHIRILSWG